PELDLVGDIGWVHAELDRPALPDIDDDGFQLGVGLRSRVHDAIEVQAGIRYLDLDDSDTFLTLAGRYYLTDNVAAGLGLRLNDDDTGWSVSLRAEFGKCPALDRQPRSIAPTRSARSSNPRHQGPRARPLRLPACRKG